MLTKCPECGKQISDQAAACPECGYLRLTAQQKVQATAKQMMQAGCAMIFLGLLFLFILMMVLSV